MNKEQIELASKILVEFCKGEIAEYEATTTIVTVLRIMERLNGINRETEEIRLQSDRDPQPQG